MRAVRLAAKDLDRDGDLAATNSRNSAPGKVSVLKNRGNGIFGKAIAYNAGGAAPTSVATADLDGDRKTNLAVDNFSDGSVSVLTSRGNGAFGKATGYRVEGAFNIGGGGGSGRQREA